MSNEELLSYLIVSGKIDTKIYDDRKFNRDIFKLLLDNDDIWNLNSTLEYVNKICKDFNVYNPHAMISICVANELSGYILFTKTLYNTLNFDFKGWYNTFTNNKTDELFSFDFFSKHLKSKVKSLKELDTVVDEVIRDISALWRIVSVNVLNNTIEHGTADGKGFYALKFDGKINSNLNYYHMNNIDEYKNFREKDYFVIF